MKDARVPPGEALDEPKAADHVTGGPGADGSVNLLPVERGLPGLVRRAQEASESFTLLLLRPGTAPRRGRQYARPEAGEVADLAAAVAAALPSDGAVFEAGRDYLAVVLDGTSRRAALRLASRVAGCGAPTFTWVASRFPRDARTARGLVQVAARRLDGSARPGATDPPAPDLRPSGNPVAGTPAASAPIDTSFDGIPSATDLPVAGAVTMDTSGADRTGDHVVAPEKPSAEVFPGGGTALDTPSVNSTAPAAGADEKPPGDFFAGGGTGFDAPLGESGPSLTTAGSVAMADTVAAVAGAVAAPATRAARVDTRDVDAVTGGATANGTPSRGRHSRLTEAGVGAASSDARRPNPHGSSSERHTGKIWAVAASLALAAGVLFFVNHARHHSGSANGQANLQDGGGGTPVAGLDSGSSAGGRRANGSVSGPGGLGNISAGLAALASGAPVPPGGVPGLAPGAGASGSGPAAGGSAGTGSAAGGGGAAAPSGGGSSTGAPSGGSATAPPPPSGGGGGGTAPSSGGSSPSGGGGGVTVTQTPPPTTTCPVGETLIGSVCQLLSPVTTSLPPLPSAPTLP